MRLLANVLVVALCGAIAAGTARAQTTQSSTAITVGAGALTVFEWPDEMIPFVDFRATHLARRGAGSEFSVAISPIALGEGVLAGIVEIGPAIRLAAASNAHLLLRLGGGIAGIIYTYGGIALPEAYLGLGVVHGKRGTAALRADASLLTPIPFATPVLRLGVGIGGFTGGAR